jgi:hypothetical protein
MNYYHDKSHYYNWQKEKETNFTRNIFIIEDDNYTVLNVLKDESNKLYIVELPFTYSLQDFFSNLQTHLMFDKMTTTELMYIHTNISLNSSRWNGILSEFVGEKININHIDDFSESQLESLERDFIYLLCSGKISTFKNPVFDVTNRLINFTKLQKIQKIAFLNAFIHSKSSYEPLYYQTDSEQINRYLKTQKNKIWDDVTVEEANRYL